MTERITTTSFRLKLAIAVVTIVTSTMVSVSCGGTTTPNDGTADLKGTIEIDGSSTVFPITEAVAEEFNRVNRKVQVNVGVSGTGGGFSRFVVGETDINDASRAIKPSEEAQAAENGIEFIEFRVAYDGLSVAVNPRNDFITCLTVEELKRIWEPESSVDSWSSIRSTFPDDKLRLYGPDTDSGTFDYFTEEVVGESQASRPDYSASADDNVLVQGISGDRSALGYFGYAYLIQNQGIVKAVAIDGGGGCVLPSHETIASGEYTPLSRPLFIYVNKASLDRPVVAAFLRFYMENAGVLAEEVGYVSLQPFEYDENLSVIPQEEQIPSP
ncbi:MAG: PstS family phosphate ABC transporter substrate-binding protein [Chloroflexi bacterium]|nr:PstS family phosphate ABC transporter substrate-binding protein [Chloroflexota bacterium]